MDSEEKKLLEQISELIDKHEGVGPDYYHWPNRFVGCRVDFFGESYWYAGSGEWIKEKEKDP